MSTVQGWEPESRQRSLQTFTSAILQAIKHLVCYWRRFLGCTTSPSIPNSILPSFLPPAGLSHPNTILASLSLIVAISPMPSWQSRVIWSNYSLRHCYLQLQETTTSCAILGNIREVPRSCHSPCYTIEEITVVDFLQLDDHLLLTLWCPLKSYQTSRLNADICMVVRSLCPSLLDPRTRSLFVKFQPDKVGSCI